MNPKVYVGTYAKYNNGSIAGGWISLKSCKNYDDFLSKCYALHRDEREPELMVQDTDDFPDGLSCGESFGEEDFNDVMAAIKTEETEEKKPSGDKALLPEFKREMAKVWSDEHMLDNYECKQFSYAVRLQNGGILKFKKPSIENRFCWADEGPSLDAYNRITSSEERLKQYFLRENLAQFDKDIEQLQSLSHDGTTLYLQRESYSQTEPLNLWQWKAWSEWDVQENPSQYHGDHMKMTEADRKTILEGVKHEREKFEKRLNAYLKRYGTRKLKTWTYWADA